MRSAYQWGVDHASCPEALALRAKCHGSQRRWWRECHRGDWLIWQLEHGAPADQYMPALLRACDRIVERAIRRSYGRSGVPAWETWARRWLNGDDRSRAEAEAAEEAAAWSAAEAARSAVAEAARSVAAAEAWSAGEAEAWSAEEAAAWSAAEAEAWSAELLLQARDIRREIPCWLWEV